MPHQELQTTLERHGNPSDRVRAELVLEVDEQGRWVKRMSPERGAPDDGPIRAPRGALAKRPEMRSGSFRAARHRVRPWPRHPCVERPRRCDNANVAKLDDFLDRMLFGVATRVSGRTVAAIALLLYAGVGLLLPLSLDWPLPYLVSANVVGTSLAASLVMVWFAVQVQARDRRHLVEWSTDLRLLDAAEFEWLVGELFRREGWKVEETGRQGAPDGNIDLRLSKDGHSSLVQCKRWASWLVGVDDVRAFAGTLLREGRAGSDGIFVTLSDFTEQAREEAAKTGLTLVDNRDLYSRVEGARRNEPCPNCQAPMVLDRSPRGWWFRCIARGCAGKRDLGNDPARAVELLTQLP